MARGHNPYLKRAFNNSRTIIVSQKPRNTARQQQMMTECTYACVNIRQLDQLDTCRKVSSTR